MIPVQLDPIMEKAIDDALAILNERAPQVQWKRAELIRLAIGYGLKALFRQDDRIVVDIPAMCWCLHPPGNQIRAIIEDLSATGARIHFPDGNLIQKNDVLLLSFRLPDDNSTPVQVLTLVHHVCDRYAGTAFLKPDKQTQIRSFLACHHQEK